MEQLVDLYNSNSEDFLDIISKNNVKIIGTHLSFKMQVIYNESRDCVTYHEANELSLSVGPEITDIYKLFTKGLNETIVKIDKKKNVLKNYNYLLCELYDNEIYLISVIDKNNNIDKDINKVAKILGIKTAQVLFEGKLNKNKVELIKELVNNYSLGPAEFFKSVEKITGKKIETNILELIFNIFIKDKCLQFTHKCFMGDADNIEIKPDENVKKLADIYKESKTDEDFIKLIKNYKTYNKLYNIGVKINKNEYNIQESAISPEIRNLIKSKGNIVKKLYENYILINYFSEKMGY